VDVLDYKLVIADFVLDWIYIFGVDNKGVLKTQLFDGTQWLPSGDGYYDLGDLTEVGDAEGLLFPHQELKA
jgi:hypothetical protein